LFLFQLYTVASERDKSRLVQTYQNLLRIVKNLFKYHSKVISFFIFQLYTVASERDKSRLVQTCQNSLKLLEPSSEQVLRFLLIHLKKVAEEPANKMGARNLSTVFSPNLVHCIMETRRPESMISEMELNNIVVEILIENVNEIFSHA
jgi:hypothetical protein